MGRRLLCTCLICAVFAPPASAATVSFTEIANRVTVTARAGEVNHMRVTVTPNEVRITDTSAALVDLQPTEPTCRSLSAAAIRCDAVATEAMRLQLGDRSDSLQYREAGGEATQPPAFSARGGTGNDQLLSITPSVTTPLVLRGEDGNDQLIGEAGADRLEGGRGGDSLSGRGGRDRLNGGPGKDFLTGGPGNDVLQARDGTRDAKLDCGPGADLLSRDAGLDPTPISC